MKSGFFINKIPSEVPLVFANKIIIADELSFCFAYQEEEFAAFKETMFVQKTRLWAPENYFKTPGRLLNSLSKTIQPEFDLGFFSSGNWLRVLMGDIDLGRNDKENEEELLNCIIDFASEKNLSLCIFLHPIEKQKKNISGTQEYYKTILLNPKVKLADFNTSSMEGFDKIDLGIAQYSTIMFERLVLGFKTIIAPWGYPEFPLRNSVLKNCTAVNKTELVDLITANFNVSPQEFFTKNKLQKYVFGN